MDASTSKTWIAIGKLADLAEVPVETLRTWERRYGVPVASRLPSGHRRYPIEQAERLRLCRLATEAGHRPGEVLTMNVEELRELLQSERDRPTAATARPAPSLADEVTTWTRSWLELARKLDADALGNALLGAWQRHGAIVFADRFAGPWLRTLGAAWADGTLTVAQEHAASERLREVCASQWRPLAAGNLGGPMVVLANLEGEQHQLGLHLAAAAVAVAGARVVFCGADTPRSATADLARQVDAFAVVTSVSAHGGPAAARTALTRLRAELPAGCHLITGGDGAPDDVGGAVRLVTFAELAAWVSDHAGRAG